MDSSDTPQGGMGQRGMNEPASAATATSPPVSDSRELPLSVDEENWGQAAPAPSSMRSPSDQNSFPTSQDDVMMQRQQHSASLSDRISNSVENMKDKMNQGLQTVEQKLEQGKESAEKSWKSVKSHHSSDTTSSSANMMDKNSNVDSNTRASVSSSPNPAAMDTDISNPVGSAELNAGNQTGIGRPNESLVHPLASNMRDEHLHTGLTGLPTHVNEHSAVAPSNAKHVTTAQQQGLDAARSTHMEPKDESAQSNSSSGGFFHSLKEKVDGMLSGSHSSTSNTGAHDSGVASVQSKTEPNIHPTDMAQPYSLMNKTDQANIDIVNARIRQSSERNLENSA